MTNQCEHGSLRRQCLVCELQTDNQRLQKRAQIVEADARGLALLLRAEEANSQRLREHISHSEELQKANREKTIASEVLADNRQLRETVEGLLEDGEVCPLSRFWVNKARAALRPCEGE